MSFSTCGHAASPATSNEMLAFLDSRTERHLALIRSSPFWQRIVGPETPITEASRLMREVLMEVHSYGKEIIASVFTAIGRFPPVPRVLRAVIEHILDEVPHPELALSDFVRMGGDENWARSRRMTPEVFNMVATCRMLCEREPPFGYLGFVYLLETLTSVLAEEVRSAMNDRGLEDKSMRFVALHAVADLKHTRDLRELIRSVVDKYPEAGEAIAFGVDAFAAVYPLPIWSRCLERVQAELIR